MSAIRVNLQLRPTVTTVGPERSPVVCIDEFVEDPEELVSLACAAPFIDVGSIYPGVRAPVPSSYTSQLLNATKGIIELAFGSPPADELELCAYSIVTTPPARLRPIQRIPHFDGPDDSRLAFIHYLCQPEQGGTSFYRHRATGLFEVTESDVDRYRATLMDEVGAGAAQDSYVSDHTRFFERIFGVDAAFNRLIIYRGNTLHSGDISARTVLSEDPEKGRLTINGFGFLRLPAAGH